MWSFSIIRNLKYFHKKILNIEKIIKFFSQKYLFLINYLVKVIFCVWTICHLATNDVSTLYYVITEIALCMHVFWSCDQWCIIIFIIAYTKQRLFLKVMKVLDIYFPWRACLLHSGKMKINHKNWNIKICPLPNILNPMYDTTRP